jgi:hypothetical protein
MNYQQPNERLQIINGMYKLVSDDYVQELPNEPKTRVRQVFKKSSTKIKNSLRRQLDKWMES